MLFTDEGLFDTSTGFSYYVHRFPDRVSVMVRDLAANNKEIYQYDSSDSDKNASMAETTLQMIFDYHESDEETQRKVGKVFKILKQ